MPVTCIVKGCKSRWYRDKVSFHRVPELVNSKYFPNLNDLSIKRRQRWITAIKRDDLTPSMLRNQKVCGKHFISGKPSKLEDVDNPDWAPSQHMGHVSQATSKRKIAGKIDMVTKVRVNKKRKGNEKDTCLQEGNLECEVNGLASQTDLTMERLTIQLDQLKFVSEKISKLKQKIENSPLGLMDDITNNGKWKYYTGFEYPLVQHIFEQVEPYCCTTSTTILSPFNQLLLTLAKLRLNLDFIDLAYRFKISPTTSITHFVYMIEILYVRLKALVTWPDRSVYIKNISSCFREVFQEKTTIIVDCFEVFIEKPEKCVTQEQCWSIDKHHYTVKFLIGITPQGAISYISKAWGGQTSDNQMVKLSDFCNHIKPDDVVLADWGFLINESMRVHGTKLVIPAFTKDDNQLHPLEFEETQHIADVRNHVERIIGVIKNKFKIFQEPIYISELKQGTIENADIIDKMVTTCSALINLLYDYDDDEFST